MCDGELFSFKQAAVEAEAESSEVLTVRKKTQAELVRLFPCYL